MAQIPQREWWNATITQSVRELLIWYTSNWEKLYYLKLILQKRIKLFTDILNDLGNDTTLEKLVLFWLFKEKFWRHFELRKRGPTAQLWAQLFDFISVAKNFIDADVTSFKDI